LGARGVGELNADAQGFAWEHPKGIQDAMRACVDLGVPMLAHCSEPVGHAYRGKGTATPDKLLVFLAANPELSVVAAHWGGGLPFYELMPEVSVLTRNVVYDSAASTYLYQWDVFPLVERIVGPERIMFGTDYPLLKQTSFLRRVVGSGLSEAALEHVLGGTAKRVFGLRDERQGT
jgi:predicted TIM-barrel fold metal-dependent hydrolase